MTDRIEWLSRSNELPSPFMRGLGERPLRITLHSQTLIGLGDDERYAVDLLRELGELREIELCTTAPGDRAHLMLQERGAEEHVPVVMIRGSSVTKSVVLDKVRYLEIAEGLADGSEDRGDVLKDVLLAQAHKAVQGDIFVTRSPVLSRTQLSLDNRDKVCYSVGIN